MLTTNDGRALIARPSEMEAETMRIGILKNTVCAGVMARVGDLIDAPEKDANYLISLGFALAYEEPAPDPEPEPEPEEKVSINPKRGKNNARG